jgi:hypothetical protein
MRTAGFSYLREQRAGAAHEVIGLGERHINGIEAHFILLKRFHDR